MADMFGAPVGIGAAEADQRQNVLGGLQAYETVGKIEQQPAQKALLEAHAKLFGAEATAKEQEVARQQKLLELMNTPDADAPGDSLLKPDSSSTPPPRWMSDSWQD